MKNKILTIFIVILVIGVFFFFVQKNFVSKDVEDNQENISNNQIEDFFAQDAKIDWYFDMESNRWKVSGTPPECEEPLIFPSPSDLNLASSILYPGQIRGGDYKPHGGIRLDNLENNEVDVYAPMDGNLFMAARHLESGEVQYSLYFTNDCGIMYKLDHLRELTSKFNGIIEEIPMGGKGDTRTTQIFPSVFVGKGEYIATKVGIEANKNIFFDFGVYDLRKTNGVVYDEEFIATYGSVSQFGTVALCWLDYLEGEEKNIAKSLPGGDGINGKISDYCN